MPWDRGRVQHRRLPDGTSFELYVPARPPTQVLVSVLPVNDPVVPRLRAIELFGDLAETQGMLVLAPCFAYASDFRFLAGATVRYDLVLLSMIADVARDYPVADTVSLFGFSAGGQFAHRFLYVHPKRLDRVVVGAPGGVTLPDVAERWPDGVADLPAVFGKVFDPAAVRRPRTLLYVGDQDVRLARVRALHHAWLAAGIPHRYVEIPNTDHVIGDAALAHAFFGHD